MEASVNQKLMPDVLLDCSQTDQVCFWAKKFEVSPMAIRTAVRACCSNSISQIAQYIQQVYLPAKQGSSN
jgi:hypothetical protein